MFPVWFAVIEQVPAATIVAVLPVTVHTDGLLDVKTIGLPDAPPVAERATVAFVAKAWSTGLVNVIVCWAWFTTNDKFLLAETNGRAAFSDQLGWGIYVTPDGSGKAQIDMVCSVHRAGAGS